MTNKEDDFKFNKIFQNYLIDGPDEFEFNHISRANTLDKTIAQELESEFSTFVKSSVSIEEPPIRTLSDRFIKDGFPFFSEEPSSNRMATLSNSSQRRNFDISSIKSEKF